MYPANIPVKPKVLVVVFVDESVVIEGDVAIVLEKGDDLPDKLVLDDDVALFKHARGDLALVVVFGTYVHLLQHKVEIGITRYAGFAIRPVVVEKSLPVDVYVVDTLWSVGVCSLFKLVSDGEITKWYDPIDNPPLLSQAGVLEIVVKGCERRIRLNPGQELVDLCQRFELLACFLDVEQPNKLMLVDEFLVLLLDGNIDGCTLITFIVQICDGTLVKIFIR